MTEPEQSRATLFDTAHLEADLKLRSMRGGAMTLSAQAARFVLQIGSTMVLARLLVPADFGLIAMVTVITSFAMMFKDAGLSTATIQRAEVDADQITTLFWINVCLGIAAACLIASLAPLIAWIYGEPRLILMTIVLASSLVLSGLSVQHQALLRRQMRYDALATIDVLSLLAGIAFAIVLAVFGARYWSLVAMITGTSMVMCLLSWHYCHWIPGLPTLGGDVRSMLGFGGTLTGFNIFNYFTRNADNVIIGILLGSASLGLYSKAYQLLMLPIRQLNAPVSNVMLSSLSRLQTDPVRFRRAYLRAVSALAMIGMPIVACLFVAADEVILIVLGADWAEAADVFKWLAPAAFLGTLNIAPGWLCTALGRARVQLGWAAITAPLTVCAFLIGVKWGIVGVAAAFSATWCLSLFVFLALACYRSPVSLGDIVHSIAPIVLMSVLAGIATSLVRIGFSIDGFPVGVRLSVLVVLFSSIYLSGILAMPLSRSQFVALFRDGLMSLQLRPSESAR
ncbi:MAG: lipopolysaccharide biosynthesis protein [Phycisphaerales bacterium]